MVSYLLNFSGVFGVGKPRGFCVKMSIKSRMFDAWIVVDGGEKLQNYSGTFKFSQSYSFSGLSVPFNDGAVVELAMHADDALRCVHLSS